MPLCFRKYISSTPKGKGTSDLIEVTGILAGTQRPGDWDCGSRSRSSGD